MFTHEALRCNHPGELEMQDKMAAPKVTDTRTELAELIKKRAEIAVSFYQIVIFFYKSWIEGVNLGVWSPFFTMIFTKIVACILMTSAKQGAKINPFYG